MTDKPVYSMSGTGDCSRVMAAQRLGHDPTPQSEDDLERLKHYTRCEALAAQEIMDLGYRLESGMHCLQCQVKYGTERHGIHVEIDTALFLLVGHLDRRLILDDNRRLPVEIKSLGKPSWQKFLGKQFAAFNGYACQEACYLEAEQSPGIYWVMDRDSGKPLKYIVNDWNDDVNLDGFTKTYIPTNIDHIIDKINLVEIAIQSGVLPEGDENDNCYFCRYKYLCIKPEDKKLKIETSPSLVEAAQQYKDALEAEKVAGDMKSNAIATLLTHAKQNKVDKFKVAGVSFTYHGWKPRNYLDQTTLKAQEPEIYKKYMLTKESDSYTIKRLKE